MQVDTSNNNYIPPFISSKDIDRYSKFNSIKLLIRQKLFLTTIAQEILSK
jgi:hypothetical protein